MVRCSMMPVASGPGVPAPRPKLGFSIDSLVGDGADSACSPPRPGLPASTAAEPAAASPEPRRKERHDRDPAELHEAPEAFESPAETDMLQQRLAHERALHERLLAHGLGGGPLGAFGPLAPLARFPLADPRYMKLAQLRGELALGRAGGGVPAGLPGLLSHQPPAPAAPSEMPLYPWLMSRHGRVFPGRYAPGPHLPEFLFQPFRKPKRIRTAFSPTQLLKLEHAFEKNHYVVGQERKQLAQTLSLSETQVKVWFQNRRTKHKRSADGGEGGDGAEGGAGSEEGAKSEEPGLGSDTDSDDNASVGIDVTN